MDIKELGEFGLIRHLTENIKLKNASTVKGVGDDCAILNFSNEKDVLVTTDLLLEGVHFDLTYVPLKHLGYKSAMVNFSDVYAMGGIPRQITVSLGISQRFTVEDMEEFYAGLQLACESHGVDLVGGDTTSSMTGLTISITCVGDTEKGKSVCRNGAKPTDLICVTGNLGAAYLGLQLLEREKEVYYQQLQENKGQETLEMAEPDFAGKEYLLQRQLRPEARRDIIMRLRELGLQPTSMMDISDGLSSELMHICSQSQCGCRVYEAKLPIDYETASQAEEFNMNVTTCALNGGEDYELLCTFPLSAKDMLEKVEDLHLIGYITSQEDGLKLITRDNNEFELKAQGWNHMKE